MKALTLGSSTVMQPALWLDCRRLYFPIVDSRTSRRADHPLVRFQMNRLGGHNWDDLAQQPALASGLRQRREPAAVVEMRLPNGVLVSLPAGDAARLAAGGPGPAR